MNKFFTILKPIVFQLLRLFLLIWFWLTKKDPGGTIRETIYELIEQDEQDPEKAVDTEERTLLMNILSLKETFINKIMIPRARIIGIDQKESVENAMGLMVKNQVNRLIVFDGHLDKVVGCTTLLDCLRNNKKNLRSLAHELDGISPRMSILDLLIKMQQTGEKMVLALDDHGGTEGIVTFDDLIEEMIGNMKEAEEQLLPPGRITVNENGELEVDGHVELDELEELENQHLHFIKRDDIEINTIAGYICAYIGRLPSPGELITHPDGREYLILDASPRRIKRVCIRNRPKDVAV